MKHAVDDRFRRQHGVVSRPDALADGLSYRQIQYRVASGLWIAAGPGVYRHAAHPVTPEQQILAALLSAGPGAVASHESAAYLWGLLDWHEAGERPAVTVLSPAHPRAHGFDVHRVGDLDWGRVRRWKGIECTDPLWTLCDLGATVDGTLLDRAIDRALARRLVSVSGLEAEVGRRSKPGRRGVGSLRERLAIRGYIGAPEPSVLESRTTRFLARHRIAIEQTEVVDGPDGEYRIDFSLAYPVMLEVDGYVWHYTPEHKARDDERRNRLRLAGIELYVSNWRQLHRGEARLASVLRQAVSRTRVSRTQSRTPGRP
jgi:hypothetical protein